MLGNRQCENSATEYLWCGATCPSSLWKAPSRLQTAPPCSCCPPRTGCLCRLRMSSCSGSAPSATPSTGSCGSTKWRATSRWLTAAKWAMSPRPSRLPSGHSCLVRSEVLPSFRSPSLGFSNWTHLTLSELIILLYSTDFVSQNVTMKFFCNVDFILHAAPGHFSLCKNLVGLRNMMHNLIECWSQSFEWS